MNLSMYFKLNPSKCLIFSNRFLIELQAQKDQLDVAVLTKKNEVKTLLNYKVATSDKLPQYL